MSHIQTFYYTGLIDKGNAEKIRSILEDKTRVEKVAFDLKRCSLTIRIKNDYEKLTLDAVQNIFDFVIDGCIVSDIKKSEAVTAPLVFITTAIGLILFLLLKFVGFDDVYSLILSVAALVITGYDTFLNALKGIFKINLDRDLLISAACIAAFFTEARLEAVLVLIIFRIGKIVEYYILKKSRKSINNHINIYSETAKIQLSDGTYKEVSAKDVPVGSVILLNPFEILSLDARVIKGKGLVDGSRITGDLNPIEVEIGDIILSGSVNCDFPLHLETTADFENSTATAVTKLVRNSTSKKAKLEKSALLISKIFVPTMLVIAGLVACFLSPYYAVCLLIASSPYPAVLSLPIGFFASIGMLSSRGALIKGGRSLEVLARAKNIAFDKTGTLTNDNLKVSEIMDIGGVGKENVLTLCAALEQFSNHPIAKAVLKEAQGIELPIVNSVKEKAGYGITAEVNGKHLLCGSQKLLETCGVSIKNVDANLYLSFGKKLLGAIRVSYEPLNSAKDVVSSLKADGIENVFMLSSDNEKTAKAIASKIGINKIEAPLLPDEKIKRLKNIEKEYGKVIYVGDGKNDESVISEAKTGLSLGLSNSVATDNAEIVFVQNELKNLPKIRKLAYKAISVIDFNLWITVVIKLVLMILSFFGYIPMWPAVLIDAILTIFTLLNSLRILKIK